MVNTRTVLLALTISLQLGAQTTITDFETFTLSPNSAYSPTTSTPFQTAQAKFHYEWNDQFSFWSGGFSYTNIYDSITAGYMNEYGVRAYKGVNNSATFIVGLDEAKITLTVPQSTVNGFYVTNTTYAYKSMASGDLFARKFGDTTGTGSGTTIAQGSYPDFFKLIVKGYDNGALKNDSVSVFLANFTFTNNAQDFILDTWQYVNTSVLGHVDSLQFFMRSSDVGQFGINTPLYFALDNFEMLIPSTVGIDKNKLLSDIQIYPNPFRSELHLLTQSLPAEIVVSDVTGKLIYSEILLEKSSLIDLSFLQSGVYMIEIKQGFDTTYKKLIKN
jgi:hypothetical protein